jgi:hypothetical protein
MKPAELKALFAFYHDHITKKQDFYGQHLEADCGSLEDSFEHASDISADTRIKKYLFMCEEGGRMAEEGDIRQLDRAIQWLGFLQGALWRNDWFTEQELQKHYNKFIPWTPAELHPEVGEKVMVRFDDGEEIPTTVRERTMICGEHAFVTTDEDMVYTYFLLSDENETWWRVR